MYCIGPLQPCSALLSSAAAAVDVSNYGQYSWLTNELVSATKIRNAQYIQMLKIQNSARGYLGALQYVSPRFVGC